METLFVIDHLLYTKEQLKIHQREKEVQTAYVNPICFRIDDNLQLIINDMNPNFEVISEIQPGIYISLTTESIDVLRDYFKDYSK